MSTDTSGLKSALRPLGAALLGGAIVVFFFPGGPLVAAGVLAVVGLALIAVGGAGGAAPAAPPVPQPGDSVSSATSFGVAVQPGVDSRYARADHSHGTPELPSPPELGGDVTGAIDALRVARLQGVPLEATGAASGAVLGFDGALWRPQVLPSPPAPPSLPTPGGDLAGDLGAARVASRQGVALEAGGAAPGQVLGFDGSAWRPRSLPPPPPPPLPPPSDFVGRGEKALRIVAAGEFELRLNNGVATIGQASGYGGLHAVTAMRGAADNEFLVVVQAADGPNTTHDAYTVQLTAVRATGSSTVFAASLQGGVINDGSGAVRFTAVLDSPARLTDGQITLRVGVLVARFAT
jgi:hypothetical protein